MRAAVLTLAVTSAVHLTAQLLGPPLLASLSQVLLMPLLALVVLRATGAPRSRAVRLLLGALALSWLGDTVPRLVGGTAGFLGMLVPFLLAQLVYVALLWPWRARSVLSRPRARLPYPVLALAIVALCAPSAGILLPALVLYAAALCTMALLATGLGARGVVGGAVFVLSDSLIALNTFDVLHLPAQGFWVMLTYLLAQALLVSAVLAADGSGAAEGPGAQRRPPAARPGGRAVW